MNYCARCGDDFDEHAVICTTGDPMLGGIILCPRPNCMCFSTWSPNYDVGDRAAMDASREAVTVPDEPMIAELRRRLQNGEMD